jgi:outer membrane receptor protein involved in Fe transport
MVSRIPPNVRATKARCSIHRLAIPWVILLALSLFNLRALAASEYHGQVTFGGLAVPGATITAIQGNKKLVSVSDQEGLFSFPELPDGTWTMEVEMQGFSTMKQDVLIAPDSAAAKWELSMLPLDQIKAAIKSPAVPAASVATPSAKAPAKSEPSKLQDKKATDTPTPEEDLNQQASDGFLINGSVNNGAASPFAQLAAFGNNRNGAKGLYNGGIGVIFDNSALDARPFSLTGQNTPKASYNRITGVATLGGPLRIPHVWRKGPEFFVGYQWTRSRDAATQSALVPDLAERAGDFANELNAQGQPIQIFNPATGLPFPGNMTPLSPQAQALLNLYPLPNVRGNPRYNYQIPIIGSTHQDALQSRFDKTVNSKNEVYGDFAFQSTREDSPNLFGFLDTTDVLGINTAMHWSHRFSQRVFLNLGYRFSRLRTRVTPYWENRENISGQAGISGNNQDPMNWGPPSLTFSSGLAGLSDGQSSFDRNQTSALSYSMLWNRDKHNITFGGDFRRQQFNYLSQQNPRGTFTFTGAATQGTANGAAVGGSDLADFLLGVPDTSSIAFGNADKYFRESVYDAFITDDWRVSPQLTVNAGIRWEYGAPITELHNRLVNLDVAPGFAAVTPVVAKDSVGPLTGQTYPDSLIRPDKRGFEPRIGVSWRPISGSSVVVRAGYGIYYDTSVYQTLALQMAQQAPLSKSLSVQDSPTCPLTLANGFNNCSSVTADTFAVDPNFRPGYAQNWNLSLQRDLPGSLQLTATYLGIKGTRGVQEFLPNTSPIGALNPCPTCPVGFAYLTSGGNSTRQAGQIQLRRRLHNGFTATVQYAYSKSIDDDSALGGLGASVATQNTPQSPFGASSVAVGGRNQNPVTIAQNWLDLRAERGLSTFDQRHLLNTQLQYTTGMGLKGETLLKGWKGALFKEWTFLSQISVGSGLPQTPIYLRAVPGTGVTGSIRPDYTGAPLYAAPSGLSLNPGAYTTPLPGQWGNAGRDSIIGPAQFTLNASMGRTIRLNGRFNLDLRVDSTNLLNHVTFTSWNTTVNSAQFGLPTTANAMRSLQTILRVRF